MSSSPVVSFSPTPFDPAASSPTVIERLHAFTGVVSRIRASLDLEAIFKTTATEVRQLLQADRVAVFRFDPAQDWAGEFVSEDVAPDFDSALAAAVYDHCFGGEFAEQYQAGRVQAVADIYEAGLSDCHIKILGQFQVRANLVVPLIQEQQLWGLLCVHQCTAPRHWELHEIEFVRQIAQHFDVALKQAASLEQVRYQVQQQKALTRVISRIRESLDLETIFQTTAIEVRQLLKADRVAIFQFDPDQDWSGEFVSEDVAAAYDSAIAAQVYDQCFGQQFVPLYEQGHVGVIDDIYQQDLQSWHVEILERFQVRAHLVSPILRGKVLWGLLCVHQCNAPRDWQASEVEFASQLGEQLSMALQQTDYLQQMQQQSSQLAQAAMQAKAADRQKAVTQTVERIRRSLQIETIFQTATEEVRYLLQADRVAIFQFNPDWSGDFVAESVVAGWLPLVGVLPSIQDTHLQAAEGGRYRQNATLAVDDIYSAGHQACHVALLEEFEARAYAIAPIFRGEQLWGLLAAYQNSGPRQWQADEIDLLVQIGAQLSVALQQAEYIQQVEAQSAQLLKASERQAALATTIDRIRKSLDIEAIFTTTTQEVRQLLEVERVAIYRFYAGGGGEFVADSITRDWQPLTPTVPVFLNHNFLKTSQRGKYPRHEMFVTISQGEQLWGLLVAYQNSQPRYWQDEEVNLLSQVAAQLGVALQQAELLEHTRQQTEKLNVALQKLKTSQMQLIQGEKMASLGQLIAGIAHEINNPAGFISGNLQYVSQYVTDVLSLLQAYQEEVPYPSPGLQSKVVELDLDFLREDLPKTVNSMKVGVERIGDLVRSLRNFSRLDEATLKAVDLHAGLESTLLILQHRLKDQGGDRPAIHVRRDYGDLPLVECHAAQINQVFMNILSNAIDAIDEASEHRVMDDFYIRIKTEPMDGDRVKISITNSGLPIPEMIRNTLFDPFFTTKDIGKGTGLGLSISYQIVVDKHIGRIGCLTQTENETTFWVELPIWQSKPPEEFSLT
jgi:GAF domain-containing protein